MMECFNYAWDTGNGLSASGWRMVFDGYRVMQATSRVPTAMVLLGCGKVHANDGNGPYPLPKPEDIQANRMALATALLGDGYYGFALHGATSDPLWYDEYSVDISGTAIEDRSRKGYLGQALSEAMEVAIPGSVVFQEAFETTAFPASFNAGGGAGSTVYVTHAPDEAIDGTGSLVLSNPDHTRQGGVSVSATPPAVSFTPSNSYLLTFDWRILETLDTSFGASVSTSSGQAPAADCWQPAKRAGDAGTARCPFTVPTAGAWSISIYVANGGKIAIDNVRIYQGGVGPWRRDFENGLALVNPFERPYSFSAAELAGSLKRTAIRRIKGTQAPDVNNGQAVTGTLTLGAFDAIILLADHIDAPRPSGAKPTIKSNGVISAGAFGGFSSIAPGSWVEIYGSNLSATTRGWSGADFNGSAAPTVLDGVSVTVGGRAAYVSYISPGQVNALVPSDAAIGPMQVIVSGPAGSSDPYLITVQPTQPGLLAPASFQVNGKQYTGAFLPDGTFALPSGAIPGALSRPAKPGETIILWGIGFGPVTPSFRAGTLVSAATTLVNPLQLTIDGEPVTFAYQGLAPSLTGVYQFNVVVPNVPDGAAVPVTFRLNGVAGAQTLYIAVQR
jgi:uncharacterized protein (TIGR03437 family)